MRYHREMTHKAVQYCGKHPYIYRSVWELQNFLLGVSWQRLTWLQLLESSGKAAQPSEDNSVQPCHWKAMAFHQLSKELKVQEGTWRNQMKVCCTGSWLLHVCDPTAPAGLQKCNWEGNFRPSHPRWNTHDGYPGCQISLLESWNSPKQISPAWKTRIWYQTELGNYYLKNGYK